MKILGILGVISALYILGVFIYVRVQYWKSVAKLEAWRRKQWAEDMYASD